MAAVKGDIAITLHEGSSGTQMSLAYYIMVL